VSSPFQTRGILPSTHLMLPRFRRLDDLPAPHVRRRNLPHWETPGATYFITFRLADSLPAGVIRELEKRMQAWLQAHGLKSRDEVGLLSMRQQQEFQKLFTTEKHRALDAGHGSCCLRAAGCRAAVVALLRERDGSRYRLDRYVIMPNHVHVLVLPVEGWSLSTITGDWKRHSARQINLILNRAGGLWQDESFDHVVRARERLDAFRRYIEGNPAKARLGNGAYTLGTGSGIPY
jgi:putative transposase